MDLMPPTDSLFLLTETDQQPMHVGGLMIFCPPDDATADDTSALIDAAFEDLRVSDFLSSVAVPSFGGVAWRWKRARRVDVRKHVTRHQLPPGASERDVLGLCGRLHSVRLDRSRPLWEMHVIEGLPGGRFAIYAKVHHSVADGVAAISLLQSRLSEDSDMRGMPGPWVASDARPSRKKRHLPTLVRQGLSVAPALADMTVRTLTARGGPLSVAAPKTIFSQAVSSERSYSARSWPVERLRMVAKCAGSTVNDVVLAMCAGGLRDFLLDIGDLPRRSLVAMVPVSLRSTDDDVNIGNNVGLLTCNLGTDISDPRRRLEHISQRMSEGKDFIATHNVVQNMVASAAGISGLAPMVLLGRNLLVNPPFNVVISNIPGPSEPLYWNGALLEEIHPLSVPVSGLALNITCVTQCDRISVGLTAASDVVPEPDRIGQGIGHELEDLESVFGLR